MTDLFAHDREFAGFAGSFDRVQVLEELPADGRLVLWEPERVLARRLTPDRYVGVAPRMFTWALVVGRVEDPSGFDDSWCYSTLHAAVLAANVFDGVGEPVGWHRHPRSGRRRPGGNERLEYVAL